jgi:hypothetical protein
MAIHGHGFAETPEGHEASGALPTETECGDLKRMVPMMMECWQRPFAPNYSGFPQSTSWHFNNFI